MLTKDEIENVASAIADFRGDMTDPDWHEGMEYLLLLDPADRDEIARRVRALQEPKGNA